MPICRNGKELSPQITPCIELAPLQLTPCIELEPMHPACASFMDAAAPYCDAARLGGAI